VVWGPWSPVLPGLLRPRVASSGRTSSSDSTKVDHAVLFRLLGGEPPVPVAVAGDGLLALAGVLGGDPLDGLFHELVVLGLDRDVAAVPAMPADGWCIMIRAFGSAQRFPWSRR
jgi:hypothetical protein